MICLWCIVSRYDRHYLSAESRLMCVFQRSLFSPSAMLLSFYLKSFRLLQVSSLTFFQCLSHPTTYISGRIISTPPSLSVPQLYKLLYTFLVLCAHNFSKGLRGLHSLQWTNYKIHFPYTSLTLLFCWSWLASTDRTTLSAIV